MVDARGIIYIPTVRGSTAGKWDVYAILDFEYQLYILLYYTHWGGGGDVYRSHGGIRLIHLNPPAGTVPFVSEEFNSDKYRVTGETINLTET